MTNFKHSFAALVLVVALLLTGASIAQTQGSQTLTTTTLSTALSTTYGNQVTLASVSNVTATAAIQTVLFVDQEAMMVVTNSPINGTTLTVTRGVMGTKSATHNSGATVYVSRPNLFLSLDYGKGPSGNCTAGQGFLGAPVSPFVDVRSGRRWNCIGSQWMVDNGVVNLPATACIHFVSGNAGATLGYINNGTSATFSVPMVQAMVTNTGTNTLGFVCDLGIGLLTSLGTSPPRNISLIDAVLYYGVQQAALGTQAAVLASGTMNGATVFSSITLPAPGASETPSTVAPVRADAGSLTITPAVGSFNVNTTTAGAFYSVTFTPAAAIPLVTDRVKYYLTANFQASATTATTVNSNGLTVHYAYIPD